jgi:hypothetical protein
MELLYRMSNQTFSSSDDVIQENSASWLPLIVICLAQILVVLNPGKITRPVNGKVEKTSK